MKPNYGIVLCGFIIQLFTTGFFLYSASLFFPIVLSEFDAEISQIMLGPTIATFLGLLAMPVAGVLLDRVPLRLLLIVGAISFAAGLWCLANTATALQFVVAFGITMCLANCFVGSMTASTMVSRSFDKARGRALGISATGTSIGGMLLPALFTFSIEAHGWKGTLELFSVVLLTIMLPIIVFAVPKTSSHSNNYAASFTDRLKTVDTLPDGEVTARDFLKDPNFWYLGISLGLLFSGYSATLANLAPYVIDLEYTNRQAGRLIMLIAFTGLVGKLILGLAADKFHLKSCLVLAQALVAIAYAVLAILPSLPLVTFACVLLGLATGGMLPVWGALMAKLFGLKHYGRANGLMAPVITICVLPGYSLMGFLYDMTGNYQISLYVFTGLLIFAMALLLPLKIDSSQSIFVKPGSGGNTNPRETLK